MTQLFLSHTSVDKPFVRKLAADLIFAGFPVWLDEQQISLGDGLTTRIYEAIDAAAYLIAVVSRNALESKWVEREMIAALHKEDELKRKFLIPIVLDDAPAPLAIRDRIYADFSASYQSGLERLINFLIRQGVPAKGHPLTDQLFPLVFYDVLNLDHASLREVLSRTKRSAHEALQANQFFVVPEADYLELRAKIIHRLEHIQTDPYYSPEFAIEFQALVKNVLELERNLTEGVSLILQKFLLETEGHLAPGIEACGHFCRFWRGSLIFRMRRLQNPDLPILALGENFADDLWGAAGIYADHQLDMERNYRGGVHVDVFYPDYSWHSSCYVYGKDAERLKHNLTGMPKVADVFSYEQLAQYLIPALVARHLQGFEALQSDWWNFRCGPA